MLGVGLRLAIGGAGVGERSAVVLLVLLAGGVWLVARLVARPRVALLAVLAATAMFDLAALPPRDQPAYDDLQAFYATDQVLSATLSVPAGNTATQLSLLVQPEFTGAQPRFGLAGEVNRAAYQWTCPFTHGIQTISLPIAAQGPQIDLQLHLTGAPARDGDYLIVYASSRQGGFLISLGPSDPSATRCSLT